MPPPPKARILILTISVGTIAATGAWYGASLKTDQELKKVLPFPLRTLQVHNNWLILRVKQAVQKTQEATPAERSAQLRETREALRAQQKELERKVAEVRARQAKEGKRRVLGV